MGRNTVRFVHISDTHIGPEKGFQLWGHSTALRAERLVAAINALPFTPDFVLHTGDVVADPHVDSYRSARLIFNNLKAPVFYVTGNHDDPEGIREFLQQVEVEYFSEHSADVTYRHDMGVAELLVLDAKGPVEIEAQGLLGVDQLEWFRSAIERSVKPIVVGIHFPALPLDCRWIDDKMLLKNGDEFHQILSKHANKICGVFSGHVHRGMAAVRDGVFYCSVGSSFCGFNCGPYDEEVEFYSGTPTHYQIVTVRQGTALVKQCLIEEGCEAG